MSSFPQTRHSIRTLLQQNLPRSGGALAYLFCPMLHPFDAPCPGLPAAASAGAKARDKERIDYAGQAGAFILPATASAAASAGARARDTERIDYACQYKNTSTAAAARDLYHACARTATNRQHLIIISMNAGL